MATIKLRDYLLALSSKGSSADSDLITILDSADSNSIKTVLKSDLVDLDYLVGELQDDFLDQFGEGTFSGSAQVDHDSTTNFVANEHIDHTSVSIIAGAGLTGGGDISSDRTINIVSDNNGIVVNADQIELDTDSSTFSGGVLTKMNIEQVVSGSSQISADQTDGWVGDVKTQLNSNTVISGSSQVVLNDADKTGFDTADVAENASFLYYTDARVLSKINTEGVISGSTFSSPSQGTLTTTINGVSSNVDLGLQSGDNVTFVDGTFTGNVSINGNLDVLGDAVEIQTSELRIEDKLITVASGSADSAASDGSGLEIDGANKSLKWNHSTQQFVFDAKVSSSVGFKGEGGELTGIDTDQVTEAGNLYYTDARVKTKLNTEGVLSGSAQIASDISGSGFVSATNEFEELTLTKGSGETTVVELSPKKVVELVKNKEGHTLPKGTPVYVSGSTGNAANVYAASASREDRMPAAFILDQQLTTDQEGNGIALGFINGVDTSGFNEGDSVYVGINGGYTNVKPTGNSNRIQKLGNVINSAVNGSGVITGAGRSNDLPNIQQGYVWVGGTNDVSYQLSTSSLLSGQGVISGSSQIDVTLTTNYSSINQYTDSDNTSHLNSLSVVSGSSQIDVTQTTNYGSINQYTDSDNLSYLNSLLVVSKSSVGDLDVNGAITASRLQLVDGTSNILIGGQNGYVLEPTSGISNIFIGDLSGDALTTGDNNVGIGQAALSTISDEASDGNVALGAFSAATLDSGSYNVSIGYLAMQSADNSDGSVGIGYEALLNSNFDYNVGIGYQAGRTAGVYFTGVGYRVGYGMNTGAGGNTGIGYRALSGDGTYTNTGGGDNNTTVGYYSLGRVQNGQYNSVLGTNTARQVTNGSFNTVLGGYAGHQMTTGDNNVLLGYYSGYFAAGPALTSLITGDGNTLLGARTQTQNDNDYNSIVIGSGSIGNGSNTVVIGNDDVTDTYLKGNVSGSSFHISETATLVSQNPLPTGVAGMLAVSASASNEKLYFYDGSGWREVSLV